MVRRKTKKRPGKAVRMINGKAYHRHPIPFRTKREAQFFAAHYRKSGPNRHARVVKSLVGRGYWVYLNPCGGAWWKAVKDPKARDKARRAYYAQRARDFEGWRKYLESIGEL